jgi:hypothetical protein
VQKFFADPIVKIPEQVTKILSNGFEIGYDYNFDSLFIDIRYKENIVCEASFIFFDSDFHCQNIEVQEHYQRQGIATSVYVFAEYITKHTVNNYWDGDSIQSDAAKKMWSQKNRPFGPQDTKRE